MYGIAISIYKLLEGFFSQRRGIFTRIIGICNKLVIVRGYNIFALQSWFMKIPTHIFS